VQDPTASPSGESRLPVPQIPQGDLTLDRYQHQQQQQQQYQHEHQQQQPPQPQRQLTLATVNARGLVEVDKRKGFWNSLISLQADIICVQETKIREGADEDYLSEGWGGEVYWAFSDRSAAGVAILFAEGSPCYPVGPAISTPDGRFLAIPFQWDGQPCTITNVYGPSTAGMREREAFYVTVATLLEGAMFQNALNFLAGDLNCFEEGGLDKHGGNQTNTAPPALTSLTTSLELQDAFRWKHPNKKEFTWEGGDVASRLDKILLPTSIAPMVQTAKHHRIPRTDHKAVVVKISPQPEPQIGEGFWMLRTTLINNKSFMAEMDKYHERHPPEAFPDRTSWIESLISFAQMTGKEVGRKEADRKRSRVDLLCRQLDALMEEKRASPPCQTLNGRIREMKALLYSTFRDQHQEWKRLSAGKHIDLGERCSKYFSSLAESRARQATIRALKDPEGHLWEGTEGALEVASTFYQTLYSKTPPNDAMRVTRDKLLGALSRRLTEEDSQDLEKRITAEEVREAIRSAPRDKSPGNDGLPAEFWHSQQQLAPHLADLFNEWLEAEEIPEEINTGIITLLFKKGDPLEIKNYRPIALLPTILKLLTRVLNGRLRRVLPKVIGPAQRAAPTRFIHENTRMVADVLEHLQQSGTPGGVILLDAEKAFDMVHHDFLDEVMESMKFGPRFRRNIRTLGRNATAQIKINNTLSERTTLERGVRQGDSLSPGLFILNMEPFLCLIESDSLIRGVQLPGGGVAKVAAFADDTAPFFSDRQDVVRIRSHMRTYSDATGAKFNLNKTEGIVIGMPPPDNIFQWRSDPKYLVRYLGIPISATPNVEDQWAPAMKCFEECLAKWKKIPTTLHGKVAILKHFALPTLTYTLQALPCPELVQDRVQSMAWSFLWGKRKKALVNLATCTLPKAEGGLGYPDFRDFCTKMQSKWIRRVVSQRAEVSRPGWTALAEAHLHAPNSEWKHGDMAVHCPCTKAQAKEVTSPFWREVLLAHWKRSPRMRLNNSTAVRQPLFNNPRIVKPDGSRLNAAKWQKWVEAGVTTVAQCMTGMRLATVEEVIERYPMLKVTEVTVVLAAIPRVIKEALTLTHDSDEYFEYTTDNLADTTNPKGEAEWTTSLFPPPSLPPPWSRTYKALWKTRVPHKWKETFWLALRRSKYVGATAQRHGWTEHPHYCAMCGDLETLEHVFLDCPQAVEVWTWVDQTWTRLTQRRPPPKMTLNSSPLWQCLSLGAVQAIWQGRCARAHGSAAHSLSILKALLKGLHATLGATSPLSHAF